MRNRVSWMAVAALAVAGLARAQEQPAKVSPAPEADEQPVVEEARPLPRRSIRVLQHPYDLASFYRSREGASDGGWAGLTSDPAYGIAGFYRSHQGGYPASPHGWSAFWTNGYAARRPTPFAGYRRSIGENGDLFLMVPFLAPVGPLSGAFFGY